MLLLCHQAHDKLEALNIDFKKELINVVDGVWVAIGYALANSIMIEGDNGVIIGRDLYLIFCSF